MLKTTAYVRFGQVPSVGGLLYGVKPVIGAVVVQAIWGLAPKAARGWALRTLAVTAAALVVLGVHELAVLLGAGAAAVLVGGKRGGSGEQSKARCRTQGADGTRRFGVRRGSERRHATGAVLGVFEIGSVLFSSGYLLLAFVRAGLVERLGWLTEPQLIDAIAVGQVTPGPVFTTARFIGYVLAGPRGALAATAGIFLPAFVFVASSGPLVPRIPASQGAAAFLDGVNVASLALMAVVTVQLGRAALADIPAVALAVASVFLLVRWKVNATSLIVGAAAFGLMLKGARATSEHLPSEPIRNPGVVQVTTSEPARSTVVRAIAELQRCSS